MWLFKTLLVIILFFYAFSLIIKWIFRRKMNKLQRRMDEAMQQETQDSKSNENKNPHIDPSIGEYTDFEEIK